MAQIKGISETEKVYFSIILDFADAKTPKQALEILKTFIRKLDIFPIPVEIEKDEDTYDLIKRNQHEIREILRSLYDGQRLSRIPVIHGFIFCHYAFFSSVAEIEGNTLKVDPPHFFHEEIPPTAILSLSLLELLKSGVDRFKKHLYRCDLCGKYFFSKIIDAKIKYCPGYCRTKSKMTTEERSAYDKKRKIMLKKKRAAQQRKEAIKGYMERTGCTRKEAEELFKADEEVNRQMSTQRKEP
jgi:hypothetical protein